MPFDPAIPRLGLHPADMHAVLAIVVLLVIISRDKNNINVNPVVSKVYSFVLIDCHVAIKNKEARKCM